MRRLILHPLSGAAVALALVIWPSAAAPLDTVDLTVSGGGKDLRELIEDTSVLWSKRNAKDLADVDVFADAQTEYARLIEALYNVGYFSAAISIRLDGQEAAEIAPLDAPQSISRVEISVDTGPVFHFSNARLAPLAGGSDIPEDFAVGKLASTGTIRQAVEAATHGWRNLGHAKVAVANADLTADHGAATLSAQIDLEPGPKLRFGDLSITGNVKMRANRIRKIAGLTKGERFSADEVARAEARLRRTGIFSAVSIEEAAAIAAPDFLPMSLTVLEAKPRRYSFGLEVSSLEGLNLSGDWLHRNLFGGGERFTLGFAVDNISSSLSGTDYSVHIGIERPASPFPDTTGGIALDISQLDEADYTLRSGTFGVTFSHVFSAELSANLGLNYAFSAGQDAAGEFTARSLNLPFGLTWDRRDVPNDAAKLFYLNAEAKPFLGFGSTENGVRLTFDARGYTSFGSERGFAFAGRVQGGSILGASPLGAPRDELFYSGGGGTVRGQPYQSLGIEMGTPAGPVQTGGTGFLAASLEGRLRINQDYGAVAFVDVGAVGAAGTLGTHAGAGIGLRYQTGFGPLRVDLALPLNKSGAQVNPLIYVGLGQAF